MFNLGSWLKKYIVIYYIGSFLCSELIFFREVMIFVFSSMKLRFLCKIEGELVFI